MASFFICRYISLNKTPVFLSYQHLPFPSPHLNSIFQTRANLEDVVDAANDDAKVGESERGSVVEVGQQGERRKEKSEANVDKNLKISLCRSIESPPDGRKLLRTSDETAEFDLLPAGNALSAAIFFLPTLFNCCILLLSCRPELNDSGVEGLHKFAERLQLRKRRCVCGRDHPSNFSNLRSSYSSGCLAALESQEKNRLNFRLVSAAATAVGTKSKDQRDKTIAKPSSGCVFFRLFSFFSQSWGSEAAASMIAKSTLRTSVSDVGFVSGTHHELRGNKILSLPSRPRLLEVLCSASCKPCPPPPPPPPPPPLASRLPSTSLPSRQLAHLTLKAFRACKLA
eukprot:768302-Hanusia_phi.AAC.3